MTNIEWTDTTWNPIRGCSRVSEGCQNCYAERMAARFSGVGQPYEGLTRQTPRGPRWTGDVRFVDDRLYEPTRWRKSVKVFVNSMSDLFHKRVSPEDIARIFAVMAECPKHVFQVLTKRPEQAKAFFDWAQKSDPGCPPAMNVLWAALQIESHQSGEFDGWLHRNAAYDLDVWPLPNVWLGVSAENQACFDARVPILLECPAAVRWVSLEPLLGPIDLSAHIHGLDWVVVGGESGPGARPCDVEWIEGIVAQCQRAQVPVFVKQLCARAWNHKDFDSFPEVIRVREWPKAKGDG